MLLQHFHDSIMLKRTFLNNNNNNNSNVVVVIIWPKLHLCCSMSLFLHRHTKPLNGECVMLMTLLFISTVVIYCLMLNVVMWRIL